MRIKEVVIQNYRSIRYLKVNFKSFFGLIGSNSAGKSNILRAINLVLGERYPMPNSLDKKDFYEENPANNIEIAIGFDESFKSYDCDCQGLIFKTYFDTSTHAVSTELKAIECVGQQLQRWNLKGDCRSKFSAIYVPASRNFEYHLSNHSEWSLLGKLIKHFNEAFPPEKSEELKSKFEEVKSILSVGKFKEFEDCFKSSFQEHVLPNENEINIEVKAYDPKSHYKSIEIIPKEYGDIKNVDQMGEGMKNLIFIALLRAYAKIFPASTIFLIEEPELYLHPQGRLDLFNIFVELAKSGSQIIYTTHSQEFVDLEHFSNLGVVSKKTEETRHSTCVTQIEDSLFVDLWKSKTGTASASLGSIKLFLKNISDAETNRAFFAKKIILVEGPTEKGLFTVYCKKENLDLEKNNIEILNVGSKNNLDKFYLIFSQLNYPLYVMFDGDKSKAEGGNINKKLTEWLSGNATEWPSSTIAQKYTCYEENIEEELKKHVASYDSVVDEARLIYGLKPDKNKPIIARYVAEKVPTPQFIREIISKIKDL